MTTKLTYKGFSSQSPTGTTLYDLELAKADLMNHFMTRLGERVMAPTFGCIIWNYIFDPLTDELIRIIEQDAVSIVNADPRFSVQAININEVDHGVIVSIDAHYYPADQIASLEISFDKNAQEAR